MNYESKGVEELQAELARIAEARAALRTEALAVHAALDRAQARQAAAATMAGLSDVEKAALAQMILAQGIESGEAVGVPGGA